MIYLLLHIIIIKMLKWDRPDNENTPLHIACFNNNVDVVKNLLSENPRSNRNRLSSFIFSWRRSVVDLNETTAYGWTAFNSACFLGDIEIVKLLLSDHRITGEYFGNKH